MNIANISFLGWIHTIACAAALFIGAYVLTAKKGTRLHRYWGSWYVGAMGVLNLSALAIYRFDILPGATFKVGPGVFGLFHIESLIEIVIVALAFYSASRQKRAAWAYMHPQLMLLSFYLLIGGLINEAFVRVTWLHDIAMAVSPQAPNPATTLLAGRTQQISMLVWALFVIYFSIKVARSRRAQRATALTSNS